MQAYLSLMKRPSHGPVIPDEEIKVHFIRASGPGGQNVNKVSTAVELRFDVGRSSALSESAQMRLQRLAGKRMTKGRVLVIRADRFRTQEQNRADARERLQAFVDAAFQEPKPRVKTKPTRASKEERLNSKARRSNVKRGREKFDRGE